MSRLTNNFMAPCPPQPRQQVQVHKPVHTVDSDEDLDEICIPEGPAVRPCTPAQLRAQQRTARLSSPAAESPVHSPSQSRNFKTNSLGGPDVFTVKQHISGSMNTAAVIERRIADMNLSAQEEDECSSPIGYKAGARHAVSRSTTAASQQHAGQLPVQTQDFTQSHHVQHGFQKRALSKPNDNLGSSFPASQPVAHSGFTRTAHSKDIRQESTHAKQGAGWGDVLVEDVLQDDVDDADAIPASWNQPSSRPGTASVNTRRGFGIKGTALTSENIRSLRSLLWGSAGQPPMSWKQGFFFNSRPHLRFGLSQLEGGPCGVIASVQAHLLACLHTPVGAGNGICLNPSQSQQQACLVDAIADILWQARLGPIAYVAMLPSERGQPAAGLPYDLVMRGLQLVEATSKENLKEVLSSCLDCYMDMHGWGVVLLVISAVMSRGIDNVRSDMDDCNGQLLGMHGYCTQELVNLLLTGQACSNVFDGHKDLDGTMLKGVSRRCRVGLLTLFEWYQYVEVGKSLKTPELPIWVVCSESHFTVLFSQDNRCLRDHLPFDLHYYDELANQQEQIKLTVSHDPEGGWTQRVGSTMGDRGRCEGQNIPPLECVIETRWPGVKIDWNGTEAVL